RGQVSNGSIAEPTAICIYIHALSDRELGARILHVLAKRIRRIRDLPWIKNPPAMTVKRVQVLLVSRINVQRDLKLSSAPLRQLKQLSKLVRFHAISFAAVLDWAIRSPPTCDGSEPV